MLLLRRFPPYICLPRVFAYAHISWGGWGTSLLPRSGVRAVVINVEGEVQFDCSLSWAIPDDPDEWLRAAETLMGDVPLTLRN